MPKVQSMEVVYTTDKGAMVALNLDNGQTITLDAVDDGTLVLKGGPMGTIQLTMKDLKPAAPTPHEIAANPAIYLIAGDAFDFTRWGISTVMWQNPETGEWEITGTYANIGEWYAATGGTAAWHDYVRKQLGGMAPDLSKLTDAQKRRMKIN